jgi:hypothetical protein
MVPPLVGSARVSGGARWFNNIDAAGRKFYLMPHLTFMNRPTSVTVFGILNIVFAVIGVLSMIASLFMFLPQAAGTHNPVIQLIHDNPAFAAWLKFSMVQGTLAAVALLLAGIGLLKLQPWARTVSIVYAIYSVVMIVVGTVANYFFMMKPLLEQAHQKSGPEAVGAAAGAIGGMVAAVSGWCIRCCCWCSCCGRT